MSGLITVFIFLAIGVLFSFFPKTVQKYHVNAQTKGLAKVNPFIGFIKSKEYLILLRMIGIVALFAVCFVVFIK